MRGSATALGSPQPRELCVQQGHRGGGTLLRRRLGGGRGGSGPAGFLACAPITGVRATTARADAAQVLDGPVEENWYRFHDTCMASGGSHSQAQIAHSAHFMAAGIANGRRSPTAVRRIWARIQHLGEAVQPTAAPLAPAGAQAPHGAPVAARASRKATADKAATKAKRAPRRSLSLRRARAARPLR